MLSGCKEDGTVQACGGGGGEGGEEQTGIEGDFSFRPTLRYELGRSKLIA